VTEHAIIVGGEEWQEIVHNREEWRKLLRTARSHRILKIAMERMNYEYIYVKTREVNPQYCIADVT
jgi:hypothetical protein